MTQLDRFMMDVLVTAARPTPNQARAARERLYALLDAGVNQNPLSVEARDCDAEDDLYSQVVAAFGDAVPVDALDLNQQPAIRVLVTGGLGVGKTTLVSKVSDVHFPYIDELPDAGGSRTVTVDCGRLLVPVPRHLGKDGDLPPELAMDLFAGPLGGGLGLLPWDRFGGRSCAIVMADVERLAESFTAVDFFETRDIPFVVATNRFREPKRYTTSEVRQALEIDDKVPVVSLDARNGGSCLHLLQALVTHLQHRWSPDQYDRRIMRAAESGSKSPDEPVLLTDTDLTELVTGLDLVAPGPEAH